MVLNLSSSRSTLSMTEEEKGTKIHHQIFIGEELWFRKNHQELVTTLGTD
jgi:hypothetical protein